MHELELARGHGVQGEPATPTPTGHETAARRSPAGELVMGVLCGACVWWGAKLASRLEDPFSEPMLTLRAWATELRGGDH